MKHPIKRLLSILLTLCLLLSLTVPAMAARDEAPRPAVSWERVGGGRAEPLAAGVSPLLDTERDPLEPVRVSIVLKEESTIARGWQAKGIADNRAAMNYRAALKAKQAALAERISKEILDGEPLDVVWNITLAGNMISANVPYGKLAAIEALDQVKAVVLENRYAPAAGVEEGDRPDMYRSTLQTGSDKVWAQGITGAGARVVNTIPCFDKASCNISI